MELYELRPKTLELFTLLRTKNTIGPENHVRANGKTTALLMRAKELLDTEKPGVSVLYACNQPRFYQNMFRRLFPHAVSQPGFISAAPRGLRSGSYLLVDEPSLLKWNQQEWDELGRRVQITSVGSWI